MRIVLTKRRASAVWRSRGLVLFLICWTLGSSAASLAASSFSFAGKQLTTALRELENRGLRLVFSNRVVRPEMRIAGEPRATAPRDILDEILAPHGLSAQPTPEGVLVIGPAVSSSSSELGSLSGRVLDSSGTPLAGARIQIEGAALSAASATDGAFEFAELPVGEYVVEAGIVGYTVARRKVTVGGGEASILELRLYAVENALEEIDVAASYRLYSDEPIPRVAIDRKEILRLPHFGDDLYRTLAFLPGIASSDLSSRFNLRGGLYREILVQLDGMELIEPFHLKDIQSLFSIIDPEIIGGLDLIPGGFAVEYGDRLGGVLEMTSAPPDNPRHLALGINLTHARLAGATTFAKERGRLMVTGRRGWIDLFLEQLAADEEAFDLLYWDIFGRLDYDWGETSSLSLKVLLGDDRLVLRDTDPADLIDAEATWGNSYQWLTHGSAIGDRIFVSSLVSRNVLNRDRDLFGADVDGSGEVLDRRRFEVLGFKQDWSFQPDWGFEPDDRHFLKWGFELRDYLAEYDYRNRLDITSPIAFVRFLPAVGSTSFQDELSGNQATLYLADRVRFTPSLTIETGLRWDRQSLTSDDQLSPRIHVVLGLAGAGSLRLGWGTFYQSQRPNELEVQDGETELARAERAEHWTASWEKELRFGLSLRLDAYRRQVSDPRPRYENLFDPWSPVPEGQSDRIRVAPESSLAEGFEASLSRRSGKKLDGRLSYTLSSATDRIDGRDQPRFFDQRHAVTASLNYRPGRRWNLNLVGVWHSGWPTTSVRGSLDAGGELVIEVGPYYEENHPDYQRFDLRVSRTRVYKRVEAVYYLDIQNFDNDRNIRGFSIHDSSFVAQSDGQVLFLPEVETWSGTIPSFGISLSF